MTSAEDLASQGQIVGAYLTDNVDYRLLPMSAMVNGRLVIKTTHNSLYTGLHNPVSFTDVTGWSKEYIDFSPPVKLSTVLEKPVQPSANITRG